MPHEVQPTMLRHSAVISAPGKVILYGEHSVVYGKRALAFSLGLRTELKISPSKDLVELHLPEIDTEQSWSLSSLKCLWGELKDNDVLLASKPQSLSTKKETILRSFLNTSETDNAKSHQGLMAFLHLFTSILPCPVPFSICVRSEMPIGAGLGSSAAYGVCLSGALLWVSGQLDTVDENTIPYKISEVVCEWALCCDRIIHGKPSGIDNAICTYGGGVNFKAGVIHRLNPPPLRVILVNTSVSRNTKVLVEGVREKYERLPSVMEPLLNSFDNLVEVALETLNGMKNLQSNDKEFIQRFTILNELVDMNHCLLAAIGVSHPSLEELVTIAKNKNFHAKLTGAGGGGYGLILLGPNTSSKDIDACAEALESKGFTTLVTDLGGRGLSFNIL